jgi:hypothetical protein
MVLSPAMPMLPTRFDPLECTNQRCLKKGQILRNNYQPEGKHPYAQYWQERKYAAKYEES